jgi:Zn-dependent protease
VTILGKIMDTSALLQGLMLFVAFIPLVTLHEFAHAWVATRCGDDTPRLQGRVTIDPLAHIEWLGTIIVPFIFTVLSGLGGHPMLLGWGRPVQVNLNRFRHRRRDDILVSGAGPAINLLIAFGLLALMKAIDLAGGGNHVNSVLPIIRLSVFLCFFNLLPIPPLDGGHIARNLLGIGDEAYAAISQYSFMFMVVLFRVPGISDLVSLITTRALDLLSRPFGWQYAVS